MASLTIKAHGKTITIEFEGDDITADEWVEGFKTLMVGITFHPDTIDSAFAEISERSEEMHTDK